MRYVFLGIVGIGLGTLSLTLFPTSSALHKTEKPHPTVNPRERKPEPQKRVSKKIGEISEAEFRRRADEYMKMIEDLEKKPWEELTQHERQLSGYRW